MSDEDRVFMVSSLKTKTEIETRGFRDQDQDQDSRKLSTAGYGL